MKGWKLDNMVDHVIGSGEEARIAKPRTKTCSSGSYLLDSMLWATICGNLSTIWEFKHQVIPAPIGSYLLSSRMT